MTKTNSVISWEILRSFVDVPFLHGGRDAGQGLDCLGLLIQLYEGCYGRFPVAVGSYAAGHKRNPHQTLDHRVLRSIFRAAPEVLGAETQLLVISLAEQHYHLTFVKRFGEAVHQIHAKNTIGVVEEVFHPCWRSRIISAYKIEEDQKWQQ